MAFYQGTQTLCAVITELFQRLMATPSARHQLRRTGLVLRLVMVDPDFVLTVDGNSFPPCFAFGSGGLPPRPGAAHAG
jgi:hypothetical protein